MFFFSKCPNQNSSNCVEKCTLVLMCADIQTEHLKQSFLEHFLRASRANRKVVCAFLQLYADVRTRKRTGIILLEISLPSSGY